MRNYSSDEVFEILETYEKLKSLDFFQGLNEEDTIDNLEQVKGLVREIKKALQEMEKFPQFFKPQVEFYEEVLTSIEKGASSYLNEIKSLLSRGKGNIRYSPNLREEELKKPDEQDDDLPF